MDEKVYPTRMIKFNDEWIEVTKCEDGYWRDKNGNVFSYADGKTVDPRIRCGVGPLSLPEGDPLNDACRGHDFAFTSPYYQATHTRKEADQMLYNQIAQLKGWRKYMALPFYSISRALGGWFWECDKTR